MANINKIRLSGQTYNIEDANASKTVELTQAQYDALTVKDPNTFYIITDAQGADLSQYYTSAQTESAITQAVSGKQDTLVSGTNIKTINNESLLGSGNIDIQGGGGKAIEAGRGIAITTGETADTVSFNLPIWNPSNPHKNISIGSDTNHPNGMSSVAVGQGNTTNVRCSFVSGTYNILKNENEFGCGIYNNSVSGSSTFGDSGNTLFSVGNGTANNARHNAFEIRQNGDIYLSSGGTDIKLQDHLGGGGSSYSAGTGIDITNDVISVTGKTDTSAFTAHTANTDIHVTTAQTAAWDAKSDFSGSYNDLTDKPTIPTVPTSNTAFTNDAGYITSDAISGKADTSAVTESINAAVSGKADTSDVFITSSNRNSIVSNIHEEVYQLSTDDIYSITATKASANDIIYCQIMVDNVLYSMQGSSTAITYSDAALSGLVTADFSTSMSITLNDRENHHINEIFIEAYNTNNNSYIKEITIVHNPPIGANKIDYVSSIYTEFVHDQYAMKTDLNRKQDTLVSGTNIKTINNESILGSGNITIQGGGSVDQTIISGSTNAVAGGAVYTQLDGLKLKKITQSAYDALSPNYDANTLYVING